MEALQERRTGQKDDSRTERNGLKEERGVSEHPLMTAPPCGSYDAAKQESSCAGASASSSYAAELVQSAAKSLLDVSNSQVSDDESLGGHHAPLSSPVATLRSLQTEKLPALPDEQDRKRFLGCLASILASSYECDFDTLEDFSDAEINQHVAASLEDLSDAEMNEHVAEAFHLHDVDDDFEEESAADMYRSQSEAESCDEMYQSQSDTELDRSGDETFRSARSLIDLDSPASGDDQAVLPGTEESSSFHYADDESSYHQPQPQPQQQVEKATASVPDESNVRRTQPNPANRLLRKDKSLAAQARRRHRRRRYDLFSNLLLSTSDLLCLDKSQAKAFIPMLRSLLTPPRKSAVNDTKEAANKWLRRAATTTTLPSNSSHDDLGYNSDPGVVEHSDLAAEEVASKSCQVQTADFDNEDDRYFLLKDMDDPDIIRAFLESLSPGAGYRCLSLMLLQHLLRSEEGYDSRIRHVFKKVGVIVLVHEMEREQYSFGPYGEKIQLLTNTELVELATRKFEALEHGIAAKLIVLSEMQQRQQGCDARVATRNSSNASGRPLRRGLSRQQLVRGLKVGSAGLLAGTLFAVTGGLAAPGIAAGIAVIAGSAAATAAVVTLTSTAAVTAIFGVGGGSLAAYKMQRRTQGLTEFRFQKEAQPGTSTGRRGSERIEPELFSTICISGWLRDSCDFQRPWGVTPTKPRITDRLELLERFYSVHKPNHVSKCTRILSKWKNEEKELWKLLKKKYGRDPDHLFPINDGPRHRGALTLDEDEVLDQLFVELGHIDAAVFHDEQTRSVWRSTFSRRQAEENEEQQTRFSSSGKSAVLENSRQGPRTALAEGSTETGDSTLLRGFENAKSYNLLDQKPKEPPKHLQTVWDYHATYGGELYTVKWESAILMELCDSVADMAIEVLGGTTQQVLKATALATLMTAIMIPSAMLSAMNMIDGTWTIAIERSDEAGQELAKSLLFSRAGHRPVTLVGYSMGARVIYSCLKELARYQEKWEDARDALSSSRPSRRRSNNNAPADEDPYDKIKVFEGMREPASIVEDAILMGLPNHLSLKSWVACRQVVGGRLVNCYSRKDLILSLMFQSKKITSGLKKVCGTCEIKVPGVENFDVTDVVSGHQDYCFATGDILKQVRHGQPIRSKKRAGTDANDCDDTVATKAS